ncbi:MAG: Fe2+-dependent dioxygenase [Gammaproteobacteria bacterium]|nr:Fe2+-dependent dioxygenase [Gammaproteobacteria bacterium]
MLITIPDVLNKEELAVVHNYFSQANFVEGKLSAGSEAIDVKNNLEMRMSDQHMDQLNNLVMGRLVQHPAYLSAAMPAKIAVPFYAKYSEGMQYGKHIDDPIMGPPGQRYRTDLSITVFLNSPENYDGGELVVETAFGEQIVKLDAGNAIMYPSGSTHRVAEVTRGERIVAVTWVQSMVRDPAQRELLYRLSQARELLLAKSKGEQETELVSNAYINLMRMWSDV